jgi:hypothetical protein
VKCFEPFEVAYPLFAERRVAHPEGADLDGVAIGVHDPGSLIVALEHVFLVGLAFAEGELAALLVGDVENGDGDADDFVGLVEGGLVGDAEGSLRVAGLVGRSYDFELGEGLALEDAQEIGFDGGKERGRHLLDGLTEMGGDGGTVHLAEAEVDADVAEVAIEEAEADGGAVVDGLQLGEALGGKGFEAGDSPAVAGRGQAQGVGLANFGDGFGDLRAGCGATVEPALPALAAEPEEHVRLLFGLDAFGDGDEAERVTETDGGGDDLAALAGAGHVHDKAAIDLELVEGEGLEVLEAGVAGAEVVEREATTEGLDAVSDGLRAGEVHKEGALGDLDGEVAERKAGLVGDVGDLVGEGEVAELEG